MKIVVALLASLCVLCASQLLALATAPDPLPSWNDGQAKRAILEFVRVTTDPSNAAYVPPERRVAAFDQDGTLWVEHPFYAQVEFTLDRVKALAPQHPSWRSSGPFKYVLANDLAAMAKFTTKDFEAIVAATQTGTSVEAYRSAVQRWLATARDARWKRPYTDLIYEPMLEAMRYLRANGYRTYIVTGGGQEFVRTYAERVYGVTPDRVIGTALATEFRYDDAGNAFFLRQPKLLLDNNHSGKPEDIYLFVGQRPEAAFGNSTGDRQMLEYAGSGAGAHLEMLVLHDDATREYAYGPAEGLPATRIGTFTQALYDEAAAKGWTVVSMKRDWNRIFSFQP
jgi:phosphoserine phosphatase